MSLRILVTLEIEPSAGQSQEAAEREFARLFDHYLTDPLASFMTDYGVDTWGGYDGPLVRSAQTAPAPEEPPLSTWSPMHERSAA